MSKRLAVNTNILAKAEQHCFVSPHLTGFAIHDSVINTDMELFLVIAFTSSKKYLAPLLISLLLTLSVNCLLLSTRVMTLKVRLKTKTNYLKRPKGHFLELQETAANSSLGYQMKIYYRNTFPPNNWHSSTSVLISPSLCRQP